MSGEELRIVIDARHEAQRDQARMVAALIAEMRSLWGGELWSAAAVMGEAPKPVAVDAAANPDAALALADAAAAERRRREQEAADDSFGALESVVVDDAPLVDADEVET